jgi:predicted nucleic-acid-binding protein
VRITADTNVLVRAITDDDTQQAAIARRELAGADMVVVTLPALCELVWVLSQGYKIHAADIAGTIRLLINSANVVVSKPAAEAGLALLDVGGDFADGVIAYDGRWLGAEQFVSFDNTAVKLLNLQGTTARLLG